MMNQIFKNSIVTKMWGDGGMDKSLAKKQLRQCTIGRRRQWLWDGIMNGRANNRRWGHETEIRGERDTGWGPGVLWASNTWRVCCKNQGCVRPAEMRGVVQSVRTVKIWTPIAKRRACRTRVSGYKLGLMYALHEEWYEKGISNWTMWRTDR